MPATSEKQLRFIWAKRRQYGKRTTTPKKWKWIWKPEWVHLKKESNSFILTFESFKHSLMN